MTIEQTRFFADGRQDDEQRWKIPISIATKSSANRSVFKILMNGRKEQTFLLKNLPPDEWIKLNVFSVGIYRVRYPTSMLSSLVSAIVDKSLSPQDRFNIQTDLYALARAGHVGYVEYLRLLRDGYKFETDLTVWKSIVRHLNEIRSNLEYAHIDSTRKLFQLYVCDLLSQIFSRLGWNSAKNESSLTPILRSLILTHIGANGELHVAAEAEKRFETIIENQENPSNIDPNLRSAIFLTVAKNGTQKTFENLKKVFAKKIEKKNSTRKSFFRLALFQRQKSRRTGSRSGGDVSLR